MEGILWKDADESRLERKLGRNEEIRMDLYRLYMALIWIVEACRYDDREYSEGVVRFSQSRIKGLPDRLKLPALNQLYCRIPAI